MSLIAPAAVVDVAVAAASGGTVSLCLLLPRCHRFDVFDAASGGTVLMWLMLLPVCNCYCYFADTSILTTSRLLLFTCFADTSILAVGYCTAGLSIHRLSVRIACESVN